MPKVKHVAQLTLDFPKEFKSCKEANEWLDSIQEKIVPKGVRVSRSVFAETECTCDE